MKVSWVLEDQRRSDVREDNISIKEIELYIKVYRS